MFNKEAFTLDRNCIQSPWWRGQFAWTASTEHKQQLQTEQLNTLKRRKKNWQNSQFSPKVKTNEWVRVPQHTSWCEFSSLRSFLLWRWEQSCRPDLRVFRVFSQLLKPGQPRDSKLQVMTTSWRVVQATFDTRHRKLASAVQPDGQFAQIHWSCSRFEKSKSGSPEWKFGAQIYTNTLTRFLTKSHGDVNTKHKSAKIAMM